jgi:hypothetical protein
MPNEGIERGPRMPEGSTPGEALRWLNVHHPVAPQPDMDHQDAGAGRVVEVDPNWFENMEPIGDVSRLTPQMFGLPSEEDEVRYGWASFDYRYPDSRKIQERMAVGLAAFLREKTFRALYSASSSLESDAHAKKRYRFRAPKEAWQLGEIIRKHQDADDLKGAARETARIIFSPWGDS